MKTHPPEPWWREWPLALAVVTLTLALLGKSWSAPALGHPAMLIAVLGSLCSVILAAAVAIVRHAEVLALRLGEPAGTLLLTLAITGLEVCMVAFVMSTGVEKPTLARDTMFAVVMLVLNGFLGLALMLGGLRHHQQHYNLQSANTFLVMILPLTVLGLVLPNYTRSTAGPTLSTFQMVFLSLMSVGIYAIFLFVQNHRHRGFFMMPEEAADAATTADEHPSSRSTLYHAVMLGLYGLPLVWLAKQMATPLDSMVLKLGAPSALGGFIMAVLVLTPESIAAIRAALANRLQRSVNILLGSVLASIGLTIPLVIAVSLTTGRVLVLGVDAVDVLLLSLTLVTSMLTFSLPRTNVLLGCVHLLLFGAYLMLMFKP
ncbi:MAG: calcium:proton antiporter [Verrucomicrobia bacterium]|nr:MAG: calcium:proton antiporter [Verrucomicrobiota bacterium]